MFSTTEAVGKVAFSTKTLSLGKAICTLASSIGVRLPIVRANSPSNALKYLIFCAKSVSPKSCLSKSSNPTLLLFGIPKAAMAIRSL